MNCTNVINCWMSTNFLGLKHQDTKARLPSHSYEIEWHPILNPPICSWVAVGPSHFLFVLIPLLPDLLHRWHLIMVPRRNSMGYWEQCILSQIFVEAVCLPRCLTSTGHTCGHGSDWKVIESDWTPEFKEIEKILNETFWAIIIFIRSSQVLLYHLKICKKL